MLVGSQLIGLRQKTKKISRDSIFRFVCVTSQMRSRRSDYTAEQSRPSKAHGLKQLGDQEPAPTELHPNRLRYSEPGQRSPDEQELVPTD